MQEVTTGCYPVWLRSDLPREYALAYWRGPHGQIANKNPAIDEYLQHHFSLTDHGFWSVPDGIGGAVPSDWRMDGMTEVRVNSIWRGLYVRLFCMKANVHDEENVFDRVLAKNSKGKGSIWWTGRYQPDVGFRCAVFLRARSGTHGQLRDFLQHRLGPALLQAGAQELRAHVFMSGSRYTWWTPGVCHDEPANRRYDALILIGANSREALIQLLNSEVVLDTHEDQKRHCVAIHAYSVDRTYPLTVDGKPQPQTWD